MLVLFSLSIGHGCPTFLFSICKSCSIMLGYLYN